MLLIKEQGGCTIAGYTWENDGDATEVPYELAVELLAIKGGDFSVPEDEILPPELSEAPRTRRKGRRAGPAVTEPAPKEAELSEVVPEAADITEDGAGKGAPAE